VNQDTGITTRYFPHFEALEDAFRLRVATLLPRKHAGTDVFWRDFQRLFRTLADLPADHGEQYITSNPRDCLAFGTPRQVLQAAMLTAASDARGGVSDVAAVAARFGLEQHLMQPVRSLSGGETVRLALAKAYIGAERADRLTLASPFSWLSLGNRCFFYDLAAHCRDRGTALEIFALEDEDATSPCPVNTALDAGPAFRLCFRRARAVLNTVFDQLQNRRLSAEIADGEYALRSPCLIQGDNGQGKSLLAKVLAGAMPQEGTACVEKTQGPPGRVRLLLQDILNQALMRSFPQLAADVETGGAAGAVGRIYNAIRAEMLNGDALSPAEVRAFDAACGDGTPASMVELKILLAARRLASRPAALVLDEPDWGLRQSAALALLRGIIQTAHGAGVPVLIISHKPWWRAWAASGLEVRKEPAPAMAATLFRIRINDAGHSR
jgi:ABC-type Mn2+/Zn2+ transport system ATPase subunit